MAPVPDVYRSAVATIPGLVQYSTTVLACVVLLTGAPASAQERIRHFTVQSGGSVALSQNSTCWNPVDCSFVGCNIAVIAKPRMGRIVPRLAPMTIRFGRCAGRPTKGFHIIYHANRGARGVDEATVQTFNPVTKKGAVVRVVINIQ